MMMRIFIFIFSFLLSTPTAANGLGEELRQIFARTSEKVLPICIKYKFDEDHDTRTQFLNFANAFKKAHHQFGNYNEELRTAHLLNFTCFATKGFETTSFDALTAKLNVKNFPYFLLHHIWKRDFQREAKFNTPLQEAFLAPDFQKVIDLIELSRHDKESNLLKNSSNVGPNSAARLFTELANEMGAHIRSADENLPIFAKLAFLYLMKSVESGQYLKDTPLGVFAFHHLVRDILERWENGTATYRWFTYTIQRILMIDYMRVKPHQNTSFNTYFNIYYMSFFKRPFYDHDTYESFENFQKVVDNHASFNGRKRITPKALTSLFPHMIFLPFPFEMTPLQMLKMLKQQKWWALGYAFGPKRVDNLDVFEPLGYYFHDIQHWEIRRSFNAYFGQDHKKEPHIEKLNQEDLLKIKAYIKDGLFLFNRWQDHLCTITENETNETRQSFFALFTLYITHERIDGVRNRLASCLSLFAPDFYYQNGPLNQNFKPHILNQFRKEGGFFYDLDEETQNLDESKRDALILNSLTAFKDLLLETKDIEKLYQQTVNHLLYGHLGLPAHTPELKNELCDPTTFTRNLPREIISQNCSLTPNTWHYYYQFKFVHMNWEDIPPFDQERLIDFAQCFPPYKQYPRTGLLTVQNQHDADWPQEAYTYSKIHFGDLMPNGDEIDIAVPLWRERFTFMP